MVSVANFFMIHLLFVAKTRNDGGEEAQQRVAGDETGCKHFQRTAGIWPLDLKHSDTNAQTDQNGPASHRIVDKKASGQQHAHLTRRAADKLNEGAGDGLNQQ